MADLHNLLDEVDEALHSEEEEDLQQQPHDDAADDENAGQEWDEDHVHVELPPALEEFEQHKYDQPLDGDDDAHDDNAPDGEDEILGGKEDGTTHCYHRLKTFWRQEVACPELLPLDMDMIDEVTEEINKREEEIASGFGERSGDLEALLTSIYQVDLDRAKFMLNDLLRTRLFKIQEHPLHMRSLVERMSDEEIEFLKGYGKLVERHLYQTVLQHVSKEALKKLDEPGMIDKPNLDQYVFIKVKEDSVEIDNGTADLPDVQQHTPGTCLIARYNTIRSLFQQGKVELFM